MDIRSEKLLLKNRVSWAHVAKLVTPLIHSGVVGPSLILENVARSENRAFTFSGAALSLGHVVGRIVICDTGGMAALLDPLGVAGILWEVGVERATNLLVLAIFLAIRQNRSSNVC